MAGYQNAVLNAHVEVENGLVKFLWQQQRAADLTESVTAAEKAVKVAVTLYKAGATDFNRVALVQQNLVQQQILLARSLGEIGQGLIAVYKALGGGWQLRLDYEMPDMVPVGENAAPPPAIPQGEPVPAPEAPPADIE